MRWVRSLLHIGKVGRSESEMIRLNGILLAYFNSFVANNFEWAANHVPKNALIVPQIEGDNEFNEWAEALAHKHFEIGQAIFPVQFRLKQNDRCHVELHPAMMKSRRAIVTGDLVY